MAHREVAMREILAVLDRLDRPAGERGPGAVEADLLGHLGTIRGWLEPSAGEKRGPPLTKVQELLERQGVRVAHTTLHRFAGKHCGFGRSQRTAVRRAECEPGELAEVDFGWLGLVPDPETGRKRLAWALVVVLAHSRHPSVHVTFSEKLPDVLGGLEDAWQWFGGVPRRVVRNRSRPQTEALPHRARRVRYGDFKHRLCDIHTYLRSVHADSSLRLWPLGPSWFLGRWCRRGEESIPSVSARAPCGAPPRAEYRSLGAVASLNPSLERRI